MGITERLRLLVKMFSKLISLIWGGKACKQKTRADGNDTVLSDAAGVLEFHMKSSRI